MATPKQVSILAFQVGFGDCFLLRFHYANGGNKHILVDFGSYPKASWLAGDGMRRIAEKIKSECGGKLDGLVATHRHADHLNGFTNDADDPGSVIASCKPDVVVQPWTEDPDARTKAKKPTASFMSAPSNAGPNERQTAFARGLSFVDSLDAMRGLLPIIEREVTELRNTGNAEMANQLAFLGQNGLSNLSAVKNLMDMGEKGDARYVFYGADSGLENVLPGVKVTVLGPPTLEQSDSILKYASSSKAQYWLTLTRTAMHVGDNAKPLFPRADPVAYDSAPAYARWLISQLRSLRGRQLLELVRTMDGVLNNTSVVLLFEVGDKKLLFPGDAQLENWSYALKQAGVSASLRDVDFYKVGHHGSLNATPKKLLWENFARRGQGLQTAVSTLEDVHGGKHGKPTEVPRETLVAALEKDSKFLTTQGLEQKPGAFGTVTIKV
jgi:hypothetical protein